MWSFGMLAPIVTDVVLWYVSANSDGCGPLVRLRNPGNSGVLNNFVYIRILYSPYIRCQNKHFNFNLLGREI